MRETLFFFQRQIRMNCALDTSNSTSQPCLYHFCPTASSFLLKVHKRWRSTLSPKKLLTIPLDIWKTLLTFLKKTFVGNPNLFWLNFLKFFPGSFERTNFSPKDHFWRKEKLLKSLLKKTHEKPNFDHSIKKNVENKLLVENAFHKMFLWTRKLQFWATCGKHPPNIRIFFLSMFKKGKTHCLRKSFIRRSSGHIENIFLRDAKNIINPKNISPKVLVFFKNCPNLMIDGTLQKILIWRKICTGHVKGISMKLSH